MGFRVNNNVGPSGSLQGYIKFHCADLIAAFGQPTESDGYKVSTEWIFQGDNGRVYTLYDWKCTSLYEGSGPSVESFRNSERAYEWHIGGDGPAGVEEFKSWLKQTVAKYVLARETAKPKVPKKKATKQKNIKVLIPLPFASCIHPENGRKYVDAAGFAKALTQAKEMGGDIDFAIAELERVAEGK